MTTTNHTSPSGEDAANVAIGEREAFEAWWGDDTTGQEALSAWNGWQARAALTAEKVAAEPVDFVFPPMPPAIVMHDKLGPLFDRLSMHFYAYKCMTIAAPQQPAQSSEPQKYQYAQPGSPEFDGAEAYQAHLEAQSAEQDERAAVDRYGILNEAGEALLAAGHTEAYEVVYRLMKEARAASTQSTATQPAQTQVALTDEQRDAVEYAQQVLRQVEAGDGTFVGQCTEAIEGLDALLTAAYPEIGGKS